MCFFPIASLEVRELPGDGLRVIDALMIFRDNIRGLMAFEKVEIVGDDRLTSHPSSDESLR